MTEPVLSAENLYKNFGDLKVLQGVSFDIYPEETIAVIGPNGAGKTTLFNCLSGVYEVSDGTVTFKQEDVTNSPSDVIAQKGLGRSYQISNLFDGFTVFENLRLGCMIQQGLSANIWKDIKSYDRPNEDADRILTQVKLEEQRETLARNLSQGQKRQLEIGLALSVQPDILLLDEPTAGLAEDNIDNLVDIINKLSEDYSILFIEHDIDMVMEISNSILVMNDGKVLIQGKLDEIKESEEVQDAYLGTGHEAT